MRPQFWSYRHGRARLANGTPVAWKVRAGLHPGVRSVLAAFCLASLAWTAAAPGEDGPCCEPPQRQENYQPPDSSGAGGVDRGDGGLILIVPGGGG